MTSMLTQSTNEEKYKELLSHINWDTVLHQLGLSPKNKGSYFIIKCPKCEQYEGCFYPNHNGSDNPVFYCSRRNKCQYEDHILSYLNGGSFPQGEIWTQTVQRLGGLAGIPFDIEPNNFSSKKKPIRRYILKDYWEFLRSRFPESKAEQYITKTRKLDPSVTPFGYFPNNIKEVEVWAKSMGYTMEELLKAHIIKERDGNFFVAMYGRLAGAFVDQRGYIHNVWGRDLTGKVEGSMKYLNLDNSDIAHKKSPYGAEWVKGGQIVWVEGYLDVAAARECGIVAVASGTAGIPEEMVKSLQVLNTIVIALDRDGAGGKGAFRFIEKNANNESLKIFSINHDLMKGCKDLAELYHKEGAQAVQELFLQDNLEHSFKFAADHIINESKGEAEWSAASKENALHQAENFYKKVVASSKVPFLDEFFWEKGIQPALNLNSEALNNHREKLSDKRAREKLFKDIEFLSKESSEKSLEGNLEGVSNAISSIKEKLDRYKNPHKEIKPYTIFDLEEDLINTKEGFKTGYEELDKMTRIYSEAITLIGGRPSHGKTTLMMNIFINMIQLYPELNFYFFSYEETQQQIAIKIINILAEHVIEEFQNLLQITGYIKGKHSNISKIKEAKKTYQSLVESGRLKIIGDPLFVQDLSTTVSHLSANEPVGVVFIDYMQKVKNKERFSTRQLELQKTSEIILETAKSASIPIVLGAQLGRDQNSRDKVRLDNLREAGDLEQDANVVLGIYNPSMEKAQSDQQPLTDRTVPITVTPLKNRNGIVNKPVELIFDRPILKISNKPGRR